jgi:hypothetical protein
MLRYRLMQHAAPTLFVDHLAEQVDPATGAGSLTFFSGSAPLEPSQFDIDDQLGKAFVNAGLTLHGARCVLPDLEQCEWLSADVTVAVRWTGHDTIVPSLYVYRDIEDDLRYVFRAEGTLREADADGSITGDVDLTAGATEIAYIARTSNSDIEWIRLT